MHVGINLYKKWPYEEVVAALAENNIRHTFVNADHPEFDAVMAALADAGIAVDNLHAPFKGQNAVWTVGEAGDVLLEQWLLSVERCAEYGIGLMVGHVSNGRPMPPITDVGLARFDKYISYAQEKGVQLAFESHRYVENVEFILNRYPQVGFCLDTAHEHAFTPGVQYLPQWGNRLVATHISDNDALCDKDMHMIPFDGIVDFEKVAAQLAEVGYDATLMLEIKPDNHEKYKNLSIREYYALAASAVRRLAELVEKKKGERNV